MTYASIERWVRAQTALFPGDSEVQQLLHIFKLLGTPDDDVWPGVTTLRDWHEFPQWKPQRLDKVFPTLEPEGVDLMQQMFIYDPAQRISVSFLAFFPAARLPPLTTIAVQNCSFTCQTWHETFSA